MLSIQIDMDLTVHPTNAESIDEEVSSYLYFSSLYTNKHFCNKKKLTSSFLGFQRFAFVSVEKAKGCILFAILCLGALP